MCNVGVFTCPCSNYFGYRNEDLSPSIEFNFVENSNEAYLTASQDNIPAAETKGSCLQTCTKNFRAVMDPDLSSTASATLTLMEDGTYKIDLVVYKDTLAGSYTINLETYMSRNSVDTIIYTDTFTVVVIKSEEDEAATIDPALL